MLIFNDTFILSTKAYDMLLSSRLYKTEIRLCNCDKQECKGRFIVRQDSPFTVCIQEARRLNLINNTKEYYDRTTKDSREN